MSHLCTTATFRTIYHKRKILDIRLNIKDSRLVGVTRFELATTRPPELNFTFSNKFNELYSSGFYTRSKSCNLPLSRVIAISRVPPVFHAPSAYPIKIEKWIPDICGCRGLFIRTTDPRFLFQIAGLDAHDLSVAHDDQFAVLLLGLFNQTLLGKQNACIDFLLHLLNLNLAHSLRSFDAIILLQGYAILANLSLKQSLGYFVDFSPGAITFISPFKTSFRIAFMKYRASISNTFFSRSCIKTYFTFLILTRPIFRVST